MTMTATPPLTSNPDFVSPDREVLYALMHRAMRRDAPRLRHAITVTTTTTRDHRPEALVAWYRRFEGTLHHHHEVEDEIFWPALGAVEPAATTELAALEHEHVVLTARLDALHGALDTFAGTATNGWDEAKTAALEAAGAFEATLVTHLDREELTIFPALTRLSDEQYRELEAQARKHRGSRSARSSGGTAFVAPWVLETATESETAQARNGAPAVLFLLNKLVWQRRYARLAAILREV
jgi:hemerythrin-like domain-containing protein